MVCAATFVGYNTYKQATMTEEERLIQANLEALTDEEQYSSGRYRTVACGGSSFHDFATYCCPNEYYNNCPDQGNCDDDDIRGCE